MGALREKEIVVTDEVRQRVRQYLQYFTGPSDGDESEGPPEIPERFLVAQGRPAIDAKDGGFEQDDALGQPTPDWQGDAPIDYYALNSIRTVEAGTTVGRIISPTDGEYGLDVLGRIVRPRRMNGTPLNLGNGLRTADDDPLRVEAEVPGRFQHRGNTIEMQEVLKIPQDVDFTSGSIDSVVDVYISGGIKPNFTVKTTKALTVARAVEAAELRVAGDIQARGGIFGKESGRCVMAGGSITTNICDAANLRAAGDIRVSKEIINCNVWTAGELQIEHGAIIGGDIYARRGVKVKRVGNEAGLSTRITVGIDGAVLYRAEQMDKQVRKHQEQAEQIRARVQPLLADVKRLTPEQREQATELTAKADEIELAADDIVAQRDQMLKQATPDGNPGVEVSGILHPGVTLGFGLRETTIRTAFKGPIRVEERNVEGATSIAVVNQLTASVNVLPSVAVDLERFKKDEQTSGGPDGTRQDQRGKSQS
jgi:uncharacterized protein (DUF342 family)